MISTIIPLTESVESILMALNLPTPHELRDDSAFITQGLEINPVFNPTIYRFYTFKDVDNPDDYTYSHPVYHDVRLPIGRTNYHVSIAYFILFS